MLLSSDFASPDSSKGDRKTARRRAAIALTFATGAVVIGSSAHGAQTWLVAGPTDNWSTAAGNENWNGNVVWTNGSDATFGATPETIAVSTANTVNDITFGSGFTISSAGAGNLSTADSNSDITVTNLADTATINETFGGAGSITKLGVGTLALNTAVANTFGGGLNINAGTLSYLNNVALGGTAGTAGAVSLNGGKLKYTGAGFTNTHVITVGASGGTINNLGTGTYILGNANNLAGSGTLTITGNGTATVAGANGGGNINQGVVVFGNSNTYNGNVILQDGGIAEYIDANGVASGGTFTVNSNGVLSANGVAIPRDVTVNTGGALAFQNGDTGSFGGSITLSGAATVRLQDWWSATVRKGAIGGNISGGGGLTVNSGTGTGGVLTLTGVNTYTGTTTINGAVVNLGVAEVAGTSGPLGKSAAANPGSILFGAGGTLQYSASNTNDYSGRFSTAGSQAWNIDTNSQSVNFGTALQGASSTLTKLGTGTLTLTAANTYTGATTISAGALQLSNANAVQNSTVAINAANGLVFNSGIGTFNLGALSGTAAEALTDTASAGVTLNVGGNGATTTYTGVLSGAGGITKVGSGTLNLNAVNTYSGATIVNAGTVNLAGANPSNSIANSDLTINSGATFTAGGSTVTGANFTLAKSATLNGGTFLYNAAFQGATANVTNNLTLASGASLVAVNGAQSGGFGNQIIFGGLSRTAGATVLLRGKNMGGSTNVNSNSTNQPQNIRFTVAPTTVGGGGTLATSTTSIIPYAIGDSGYLQGASYLTSGLGTDFVAYNPPSGPGAGSILLTTYATAITSGAVVLNNVKITDASATGINAATTINSLILNSATAASGSPGTSSLDGTGTLTLNSGALLVTTTSAAATNGGSGGNYGGLFQNNATIGTSGLTLAFGGNEAIITTVGTSTLTMASTSGGITGSAGLTKSGAGNLNLNAADTFTGITTINAGQIVLGHANALQNSTLNYNNQGGTLSFGTQTSATLGGLKGAQNIALTNTSPAAVALTVGSAGDSDSTTYSGVLSGTGGSLTKAGVATLVLSGINTYTGGTTIKGGTLALGQATDTLANGGAVDVGNGTGAVLDLLNHTDTIGALTLNKGTIQTTGGAGALTTSGVTVTGTPNTVNALVTVTGDATFGSAAALALNGALTGNATVGNGTLTGSGSVSGTTGVTGGTINGTGLTLTGLTTFNSAGNVLSGTETATAGVTLAAGAAVTQTGTLTGNLNTTNTGTFTANGAVTGNATVAASGTLAGTGSIGGTTGVTSGTVNGTGLTLTGLTTFNSTGNTTAGTITATNGVTLASAAALAHNAALTGNMTVGDGTLTGTGSVSGTTGVTGGTITGTGLTLTGLTTFNSTGNNIGGTVTATGGLNVATSAALKVATGAVITGDASVSGTLSGTGSITGAVTVNNGGTLSAGNSPGSQTFGTLVFSDGGNDNWQVLNAGVGGTAGSDYDTYNATTLDLSGLTGATDFNINLWSLASIGPDVNGDANGFDNSVDNSWTLVATGNTIAAFDASEFTINVAAFNGTAGFTNALDGGTFSVALGDSNTDLLLIYTAPTGAPEPTMLGLIGLATGGLLARRRKSA